MTPDTLVDSLRRGERGCAIVLADWLDENGFPWLAPRPTTKPDEGGMLRSFCRWCRSPVSYPPTPELIKHYRQFACTACNPRPAPRLIIRELMGRMSLQLQADVAQYIGIPTDEALREIPYDLLEAVLVVIHRAA